MRTCPRCRGFLQGATCGHCGMSMVQKTVTDSKAATVPLFRREWRGGDIVDGLYHIVNEIGRGGMGVVHLARAGDDGPLVAIKSPRGEFVNDVEARRSFTVEATVWLELSIHELIAQAIKVREVEYLPRLFMEYCPEGSLDALIRGGGLETERARDVALMICWAMQFAHDRGVVHRDLKPSNVLIRKGGSIAVADFGLAQPLTHDENAAATRRVCGTPEYMPPEQWTLGPCGPPLDIYAFGVLLYELFCGRRPFDDPAPAARIPDLRRAHAESRPPDPWSIRPDLPRAIRDLMLRCLEKSPAERPQRFDHVADEIVRALGPGPLRRPDARRLEVHEKKTQAGSLLHVALGNRFRGDRGDFDKTLSAARALFEQADDTHGLLLCVSAAGTAAVERGELDRADPLLREALSLAHAQGERRHEASIMMNLGSLHVMRGEYDLAHGAYRSAMSRYEELGDTEGVGYCCGNIGSLCLRQEELDEAREWWSRSLVIMERLGDHAGKATCHVNLGLLCKKRGEYEQAAEWLLLALAFAEEVGDRANVAAGHANLASVFQEQGNAARALEHLKNALTADEQLGNTANIRAGLGSIGQLLRDTGQHAAAVEYHRKVLESGGVDLRTQYYAWVDLGFSQAKIEKYDSAAQAYANALAVAEKLADHAEVAKCYQSLGAVEAKAGRLENAAEWYERGVTSNRNIGDGAGESACLLSLGNVQHLLGRDDQALCVFAQLLEMQQAAPNHRAQALLNAGVIRSSRGESEQALGFYGEALRLYKQSGDVGSVALCHRNLAAHLQDLNRLDEAATHLEKAVSLSRGAGDNVNESASLTSLGAVRIMTGQLAEAEEPLMHALHIREDLGDRRGTAECLLNLGTLDLRLHRHRRAAERLTAATRIFLEHRDLRGLLLGLQNLALIYEEAGRREQAVECLERLADLLRQGGKELPGWIPAKIGALRMGR